jgi:outer membrane protein assembly factor BamD
VVEDYQTTSHTPEALERLVETYLALGIPQEAQKAAAVLGANYPGSKWYERAYRLIQRHVQTPPPQPLPEPPQPQG